MRLYNAEIEPRVIVKLDKTIRDDVSSGIMLFGENNDYPQIIEKLIYGSQTAKACAKIYAQFIAGSSFSNPEIGKIIVGKDNKGKPISLDRVRREIAQSIAFFNGFYIHTNINLAKEVINSHVLPFKTCRFSKEDDNGYCSRIAINNDWTKRAKKGDIHWFNTFNIDAVEENIISSGGIDKFKGQIYFNFLDDTFLYPLSPFDSVALELDTEYQVQVFKNNEIRNGFTDKIIMNIDLPDDQREADDQVKHIQSFMGADGDKVLLFKSEFDETGNIKDRAFKVEKLQTNINPELFSEQYQKSISNNIRKAINALPSILIDYDQGGLSQASGEMIVQASKYYNALTSGVRSFIAESIREIYQYSNNPILKNNTDWNIDSLKILEDNDTNI